MTVEIAGGTYRLTAPLELDARDHDVTYQAAPGERPLISGGVRVTGWRKDGDLWSAPAPKQLKNTRQLYVDGARAQRARGQVAVTATATGYEGDVQWRNPSDVEFVYTGGDGLWANWYGLGPWTEARCPVQSVDQRKITMAQPCWDNSTKRPLDPDHPTRSIHEVGPGDLHAGRKPAYVENAFEFLDEPGEWYFDRKARRIYYLPRPGEDLAKADVEVPVLEKLVNVNGSKNLTFDGLRFAYATWLRPSSGEGLSEIQATISLTGAKAYDTQGLCHRIAGGTCPFGAWTKGPGNVSVEHADKVRFLNDDFVHLGAAGLDLGHGASNITVRDSVFTDISGNGVQIGDVDQPEPKDPKDITHHIDVNNNHLYALPVEFRGGVAIFNGYTQHTTIAHNQIDHTAYSGISTGWGGWLDKVKEPGQPNISGDNKIADNLIFDHMLVLSDGAGIYNNGATGGTEISGNVVRDQRGPGHGIYTDNGSSNITIKGNVLVGNAHDWAGLRKNYRDNDGSYWPMNIVDNYWQQGDPDKAVKGATIKGNRIIATIKDAPKSIVDNAGVQHKEVLSRDIGKPGVPAAIDRVSAYGGDGFAYVAWTRPVYDGGSDITSYTVEVAGKRLTVTDIDKLGYVKVPGLTNGTSYDVKVTPNNGKGAGIPAVTSVKPAAKTVTVPGAPENVHVNYGDGKATVYFSPPAKDGGSPVIAYTVTGIDGQQVVGRKVLLRKKDTFVVISGVPSGTKFTVTATNEAGTGPGAAG
ncbi:right-handed parallel beta-helix repeat-containing protein [Lentzea sp. NBRC 105346]|uniref:fibronectin type III domain-containing protein n=1 Tax=Lentzea sp. NBRC 105346 TaxID=3032205 RepID=UPI00255568FC|nr:right-handed parallel beta-helix repeat-containing protein [Lentzea sp. NBRC 105346]